MNKNDIIMTDEKIEPNIVELSEEMLDVISACDIIYAEYAEGGAMGYAGQIMFYIIEDEKLVCYKANLFQNENLYRQAKELLRKHQNCSTGLSQKSNEAFFNYYYGGVGNHVFIKKTISLKEVDEHFVYNRNYKEYHIYSSVFGVFDSVAYAIQESKTDKNAD